MEGGVGLEPLPGFKAVTQLGLTLIISFGV